VPRFKKPPIVEAWITFDFDPKPDKVAWDMARAQEFTHQQKEKFPKVEVRIRQEYKIEESKGSLPRVVSQERVPQVIRMRDEESKRVLQIADDRLAYNVLEGGPAYPGFETLLNESLGYLDTYRGFFEPAGIRQATIHYIDIIVIPAPTIEIDHYFNVARDLPEDPFGLVAGFTTAFVTKCPLDGEPFQISLAMIPPAEPRTIRFRMEWDKRCGKVDFSSKDTIRTGLYESHEFMVDCFERSITPTTRVLFEPQDQV
jgi:uncharacterized protein (TIGR04255 family)